MGKFFNSLISVNNLPANDFGSVKPQIILCRMRVWMFAAVVTRFGDERIGKRGWGEFFRFKIQDSKFKITEYRVQSTDYRVQITDYRVQITDYRVQIQDFKIQNLRLKIKDY